MPFFKVDKLKKLNFSSKYELSQQSKLNDNNEEAIQVCIELFSLVRIFK